MSWTVRAINKEKEFEIAVCDFVTIDEQRVMHFTNQLRDKENSDDYMDLNTIVCLNINHYCFYDTKDFIKAYNSLASSQARYQNMVSIGDIQNKLTSDLEDKYFQRISLEEQEVSKKQEEKEEVARKKRERAERKKKRQEEKLEKYQKEKEEKEKNLNKDDVAQY